MSEIIDKFLAKTDSSARGATGLPPVTKIAANHSPISESDYLRLYQASLDNPEGFWREQGTIVDWIKPYRSVKETSFEGNVDIRWFKDGSLNVSYNCLDRHLAERGDKTAILWEGDHSAEVRRISFRELHAEVCRLANVMKSQGVKKGGSGHHLHADGAGGSRCPARLFADRRRPFGGLRWFLP